MVGRYAFEHWRENFERLERRHGFDLEVCADVACGTGRAAEYLCGRGSLVFAVDRSLEMLRKASISVPRGVVLMRQDMRYLYLPRRVNLLVCATDSLNYLREQVDLERALRSFLCGLLPGGYALFDMNTAWQLREGSDREPWDFEVEGKPMRWISCWEEDSQTAVLRLIFPAASDGSGGPVEEVHREKAYPLESVVDILRRIGFDELEVLDAAGLGRPEVRTRRLQFVARRGNG